MPDLSQLSPEQEAELRADIAIHGLRSYASPPDSLGLSKVLKHHKPKKQRGIAGISRRARRKVECSALLLQQNHGKGRLVFGTLTLPPEYASVLTQQYSEACRQFYQWLKRRLDKEGLSTEFIAVTEVQEKRLGETGEIALHEHFLCVGRHVGNTWAISVNEFREAWFRCLENATGISVPGDRQSAATRVEKVRKSASAYLGKYMSKGGQVLRTLVEEGKCDRIPRNWVHSSIAMTHSYYASIRKLYGNVVGKIITSFSNEAAKCLRYVRPITIKTSTCNPDLVVMESDVIVGWMYWLTSYGKDIVESICKQHALAAVPSVLVPVSASTSVLSTVQNA